MKKVSLKVLKYILTALLFITVLPVNVFAEDHYVAYSENNGEKTYYRTVTDAVNAGMRTGLLITMLDDWTFTSPMNVVEGRTLKIEMNGHSIRRLDLNTRSYISSGHVIVMHPRSKLYLYGNNVPNCTFKTNDNGIHTSREIVSGGLVYGGVASDGGGIYMKKGSELHLENTAIGVNYAKNGGGIYVDGEDCQIYLDKGAKITQNDGQGAGIYSDADGTHIHLNGGSVIDSNNIDGTSSDGGGVYFNYSWFSIESEDKTGRITNNTGKNGGGIYIDSRFWGSNRGTIKNLTIEHNFSHQQGAGIFANQNYTTIENCLIKNNEADYDGGGIYTNGKNTISNSTITGNKCNQVAGVNRNYEGGGVFVSGDDIKITGTTVIKDNSRMNANPTHWWNSDWGGLIGGNYKPGMYGYSDDDCFLDGSSVYIDATGLDTTNSLIGTRNGQSGDRKLVKNLGDISGNSVFFVNLPNSFHVGKNGNELWQRTGSISYKVTVNGKEIGTYKAGDEVSINGNIKNGVFQSWSSKTLTLTDKQKKEANLKFKMPSFDVDLTSTYSYTGSDNAVLTIDAPTVGVTLSAYGKLSWTLNNVGYSYFSSVKWYEKQGDTFVETSGEAKANTEYYVTTSAEQDGSKHRIFANVNKDTVKVVYSYTENNAKKEIANYATSASVDSNGTLNIQGFATTSISGSYSITTAYYYIKVEEGSTKESILEKLPKTVSAYLESDNSKTATLTLSDPDISALLDESGKAKKNSDGKQYLVTVKANPIDGTKLKTDTVYFYINVIDVAAIINEIDPITINVTEGDDSDTLIAKIKEYSSIKAKDTNGNEHNLSLRFISKSNLKKALKDANIIDDSKVLALDKDFELERGIYLSTKDNIKLSKDTVKFIICVNKKEAENQISLASIEDEPALVSEEVTSTSDNSLNAVDDDAKVVTDVTEGVYDLDSNKVSFDDNANMSLDIKLSASGIDEDDDATIKYIKYYLENGEWKQSNVISDSSLTLSAGKGESASYVIETWFEVNGQASNVEYYTYSLDNTKFHITVITKYKTDDGSGAKINEDKVLTFSFDQEEILVNIPVIDNHEWCSWVYSGDYAGAYVIDSDNDTVEDEYMVKVGQVDTINSTLTVTYYPRITKLSLDFSELEDEKALPTVNQVTAYLSNDTTVDVSSYFDLDTVNWYPNDEKVSSNTTYIANLKIKDDNIFTKYDLSNEALEIDSNSKCFNFVYSDGENSTYVAFVFVGADTINDSPISYTLNSLEVLPYGDVSYENALSAGSLVEAYDIPTKLSALLTDNNTDENFIGQLDIEWNDEFKVSFDPNNYNSQELVIEGYLDIPNYIKADNFDTKITLKIKVNAKQGYLPTEVIENSSDKALTCEEYMKSKDWTWSESKKACVYRVSNTGSH